MEKKAAKRIAIVGPESTGKSQLSRDLARHFDSEWVPEYARAYLDELNRPYEKSDLLEIAKGQVRLEDQVGMSNRKFVLYDTNLIVINIWSDVKYGHTDPWILKELTKRYYDFYLLTNIDLPWKPDPQREHPHRRQELFDRYHQYLVLNNCPFSIIQGKSNKRLESAISALHLNFKV